MNTTYHMLGESSKFQEWCRKNYGTKSVLRINANWVDCRSENTRFTLNGNDHPYTDFGKDIPVQEGSQVSIRLIGDSSAHVYSVDGTHTGNEPIEYDYPQFTMGSSKTIDVVFKPNYI